MMERRPWRAVDSDLFRFTTTDLRELHVAVMAAFEQAAVLAPALNLDQVRAALTATGWDEPVDDESLQGTLASLTGWGLLEATQDHFRRQRARQRPPHRRPSRLHRLLVSATAPSAVPPDENTSGATERLLTERRYGVTAALGVGPPPRRVGRVCRRRGGRRALRLIAPQACSAASLRST